jgi:hypothetical protein
MDVTAPKIPAAPILAGFCGVVKRKNKKFWAQLRWINGIMLNQKSLCYQ